MNKSYFRLFLMATLVCGVGMSVTSCKDDDDSEEQKAEQRKLQATKAMKFYNVVSHLADLSEMDDASYQTQTFEPIIGVESENDPLTRIVATNDMETAAMRFADLVGAKVNANTASSSYNDPDVGKLTYTKSTDGKSWATVDVDIKQVPHLTKIVYCSPEQMGDNGKFSGTAYYRFGDVISRRYVSKNLTEVTEYWICVRPCFGPEGKEDSHWISVSAVPEDNTYRYPESPGEMWDNTKEWYVPTKVCTDKENMQNFAEMLYAIFHPDDWQDNLISYGNGGLKMFWDFHTSNIKYHNKYFWQRVREGWRDAGIAEYVFNMPSLNALGNAIDQQGLNLLYKGYSWHSSLPESWGGWNCELYTAHYSNGEYAEEENFHLAEYGEKTTSMKDIKFDCRKMGNRRENYSQFFGANDQTYRWVVRYAKGKQLMASGKFNKYEGIVGCKDVWNYNKKYGPTQSLSNIDPEETLKGFFNRGYYTTGDVVKDENGNRWFCIQPSVGISDNYPGQEYAYFISLAGNAVGTSLQKIPNKKLAMQIMFDIEVLFHKYIYFMNSPDDTGYKMAKNISTYANVDLYELLAARDTLHKFTQADKPGHVVNSFGSALYRDDDGTICVLRLVGDYTKEQDSGNRDWSWWFYDSYTKDLKTNPRRMTLADLGNQTIIDTYNRDRWVTLPWNDQTDYTTVPSPGYRTTTEIVGDLSHFIYQRGRSHFNHQVPADIYNEPLIAFTVKRVRDVGLAFLDNRFDDGTKFTPVSLLSQSDPLAFGDDWPGKETIAGLDVQYRHQMWLNENSYYWGLTNPAP